MEERRYSHADGLSRLRAHSLQRKCSSGKRTEEDPPRFSARHYCRTRGARHPARLLEAEERSHRPVDDAPPGQDVSTVPVGSGVGDVPDGKVVRLGSPTIPTPPAWLPFPIAHEDFRCAGPTRCRPAASSSRLPPSPPAPRFAPP